MKTAPINPKKFTVLDAKYKTFKDGCIIYVSHEH